MEAKFLVLEESYAKRWAVWLLIAGRRVMIERTNTELEAHMLVAQAANATVTAAFAVVGIMDSRPHSGEFLERMAAQANMPGVGIDYRKGTRCKHGVAAYCHACDLDHLAAMHQAGLYISENSGQDENLLAAMLNCPKRESCYCKTQCVYRDPEPVGGMVRADGPATCAHGAVIPGNCQGCQADAHAAKYGLAAETRCSCQSGPISCCLVHRDA